MCTASRTTSTITSTRATARSCQYQQETHLREPRRRLHLRGRREWPPPAGERRQLHHRCPGCVPQRGDPPCRARWSDDVRILSGVEGCESTSFSEDWRGVPAGDDGPHRHDRGHDRPPEPERAQGLQADRMARRERDHHHLGPRAQRPHPAALTARAERRRRGHGVPSLGTARRIAMLSVRDPIRRRQPIERPLDVIGLELLVTISQALLAGILLSLAAQLVATHGRTACPSPACSRCWRSWSARAGCAGWSAGPAGSWPRWAWPRAILTGALWLLSLQDASVPRIDWLVGLLAVACAIYGLVAGAFLDGTAPSPLEGRRQPAAAGRARDPGDPRTLLAAGPEGGGRAAHERPATAGAGCRARRASRRSASRGRHARRCRSTATSATAS